MSDEAETTVTPYRNGPYLVRGSFRLIDQAGDPIERRGGTIALCRCGRSGSKPFCDGTHKVIGFSADSQVGQKRSLEPQTPGDAG